MYQLELFPPDVSVQGLAALYRLHEPIEPVVFSRLAMLAQSQQNVACFCQKSQCPSCRQNLLGQQASQQTPYQYQEQNAVAHYRQDPGLALAKRQLHSVYTEAEKQVSCAPSLVSSFRSGLDKYLTGILHTVSLVWIAVLALLWILTWLNIIAYH